MITGLPFPDGIDSNRSNWAEGGQSLVSVTRLLVLDSSVPALRSREYKVLPKFSSHVSGRQDELRTPYSVPCVQIVLADHHSPLPLMQDPSLYHFRMLLS